MLKLFQAKDRTEEILERYLDGDFSSSAALDEAPTRAQLKAVAKRYGCRLPEEFLAHSTGEYGGIYIEVKERLAQTGGMRSRRSGLPTASSSTADAAHSRVDEP